nr:MAG TPA: hypothetical protein [Caudoviricetes sp.]DAN63493.1 MAG TPA: hypothetical protein [Caudoviricetes sp.]
MEENHFREKKGLFYLLVNDIGIYTIILNETIS